MKKFLFFIVVLAIPLRGYGFPDIPRSDWSLSTLMDFFEEPQYFDRGINTLKVEWVGYDWDKHTMNIFGRSRDHSIVLTKGRYEPLHCHITDKGGKSEVPISKEEYQHPKYKDRLVWFFYFEKGVLAIELSKNSMGKIRWANSRWQTHEMIDETRPSKDEIDDMTPIHKAIESNNWSLTESLIETGADLDSCALIDKGKQKYIAPPAIRLVLKASPSLSEYENKTILNLIKKLIYKGTDLDVLFNPCWGDANCEGSCITTQGNSLLIYSITGDHWEKDWIDLAELLLNVGVDPNFSYGRSKWKPIQFALQNPTIEKTKLLLDYGSSVSDIDCFSWLGFTFDANEFKQIVRLLINSGADPHRRSDRGLETTQIRQCIRNLKKMSDDNPFKSEIMQFLEQINWDG